MIAPSRCGRDARRPAQSRRSVRTAADGWSTKTPSAHSRTWPRGRHPRATARWSSPRRCSTHDTIAREPLMKTEAETADRAPQSNKALFLDESLEPKAKRVLPRRVREDGCAVLPPRGGWPDTATNLPHRKASEPTQFAAFSIERLLRAAPHADEATRQPDAHHGWGSPVMRDDDFSSVAGAPEPARWTQYEPQGAKKAHKENIVTVAGAPSVDFTSAPAAT